MANNDSTESSLLTPAPAQHPFHRVSTSFPALAK